MPWNAARACPPVDPTCRLAVPAKKRGPLAVTHRRRVCKRSRLMAPLAEERERWRHIVVGDGVGLFIGNEVGVFVDDVVGIVVGVEVGGNTHFGEGSNGAVGGGRVEERGGREERRGRPGAIS